MALGPDSSTKSMLLSQFAKQKSTTEESLSTPRLSQLTKTFGADDGGDLNSQFIRTPPSIDFGNGSPFDPKLSGGVPDIRIGINLKPLSTPFGMPNGGDFWRNLDRPFRDYGFTGGGPLFPKVPDFGPAISRYIQSQQTTVDPTLLRALDLDTLPATIDKFDRAIIAQKGDLTGVEYSELKAFNKQLQKIASSPQAMEALERENPEVAKQVVKAACSMPDVIKQFEEMNSSTGIGKAYNRFQLGAAWQKTRGDLEAVQEEIHPTLEGLLKRMRSDQLLA